MVVTTHLPGRAISALCGVDFGVRFFAIQVDQITLLMIGDRACIMDLQQGPNVLFYMVQAALPLAAFFIFGLQKVSSLVTCTQQYNEHCLLGRCYGLVLPKSQAQMGP